MKTRTIVAWGVIAAGLAGLLVAASAKIPTARPLCVIGTQTDYWVAYQQEVCDVAVKDGSRVYWVYDEASLVTAKDAALDWIKANRK